MALDREDTLKKAEKLLRQGRLDAAIAEYVRVVEDQPRDWNTANTLGDLYARSGQSDKAIAQYTRIADHFSEDGFYPKAAALYKKILKLSPDDERAQMRLAELSADQGLVADAKAYFNAVATKRKARGDKRGVDEIVVRLGDLDPTDVDARQAAARVVAEAGHARQAAARYRAIHDDLLERGRTADALAALREAVQLDPADKQSRAILAKEAVASGDLEKARGFLDRETAGDDPTLLIALADLELRSGELDQARAILPQLLAIDRDLRNRVVDLAWTLTAVNQDAAFVCIECAVDASLAASAYDDAAAVLQEFITRLPNHIPALLKLVEICVDGGLETTMYDAQAHLADAYLAAGQGAEARVIAEDLVAREPWEQAHIERFRRALVMLRVPEPDSVIAERLSGQSPFTATDLFADPVPAPAPEAPPAVEPEPAAAAPPPPVARPAAAAPKPPSGKPPGAMEIDLTNVLGDLQPPALPLVPPPQNLEQVFGDFRSQVSAQSGDDEAEQHKTLGDTFLEMGMTDEALAAYETAARSPRLRFEAGAILARLYRDRGELPQAIEWFERAAEAPAPGFEEGRALLYDLGSVLESMGETARALAVFLELQADAGDYRDVTARVDHLSRVQTGG